MKGWAELLLLAGVLVASWTRTPIGAAATGAVALLAGQPTPDLLASFRTELPAALQESLGETLVARPILLPGSEGLTGFDAAVRTAIAAHLGAEALAEIESLDIDQPEAALEVWAVGSEVRARAIRRARAAGQDAPESLAGHRRFLAESSAAEAERVVGETLALATVLDLAWPVDPGARVSSGFGYRDHPTLKKRKLHEGVDIAVPVGTSVHAAGDGRVKRARFDEVNGNYVKLDHGHRVSTAYCHGEAMHVDKGQVVTQGQLVLASGNTGRSTGPHLHFGLRIGGRAVDPAPFRARGAAAALAASAPAGS